MEKKTAEKLVYVNEVWIGGLDQGHRMLVDIYKWRIEMAD